MPALQYFDISVTYPQGFQICYNNPMFYVAAIFVKYCYTTGSWLFWVVTKYALFGLLTARGKSIVKQDYYVALAYHGIFLLHDTFDKLRFFWAHFTKCILTLKRPGLCGWLRPTQFKPRLDWVGSAAQVRRYCVDSAAQAFIHALVVASRAVYSTRFAALAVRGPRILRPTRLMFSQPMSLLVSHNLALSGRVKNVYRHLLHFLTLMFSNKVETDQYIFHLLFLRHKCADYLCHSLHRYACRYTGTLPFI